MKCRNCNKHCTCLYILCDIDESHNICEQCLKVNIPEDIISQSSIRLADWIEKRVIDWELYDKYIRKKGAGVVVSFLDKVNHRVAISKLETAMEKFELKILIHKENTDVYQLFRSYGTDDAVHESFHLYIAWGGIVFYPRKNTEYDIETIIKWLINNVGYVVIRDANSEYFIGYIRD